MSRGSNRIDPMGWRVTVCTGKTDYPSLHVLRGFNPGAEDFLLYQGGGRETHEFVVM